MKLRLILNWVVLILIVGVIFLARHDLVEAWQQLRHVNLLILALIIPMQFLSYFSSAEVIFAYLRGRGKLTKVTGVQKTSMALELNFVNHVFPSGGVSGISYMVWRLGRLGVRAGQATMAQIMRLILQFAVFAVLLALALLFASFDNRSSNFLIMATSFVVAGIFFVVFFGGYLVGSEMKMRSFARWLGRGINGVVRRVSFGRVAQVVRPSRVEHFLLDFHADYLALKRDKKLLVRPTWWALAYNLVDMSLFFIAFWALGIEVNVSAMVLGYGAASLAGVVVFTPGGAGAYEVIMAGILVAGGMSKTDAAAGVVLARVIVLIVSLAAGWFAYYRASQKFGRPKMGKGEEEEEGKNAEG